jgi:hypothetical protein
MRRRDFETRVLATAGALAMGLGLAATPARAAVIPGADYNFNGSAPTSSTQSGGYASPGTFENWQVQGGSDASTTITGGVDTNGTASGATPAGNALFTSWEQAGGTYTFLQLSNYYANPTSTVPGGASGPEQVQVSLDLFVDGATGPTPLSIQVNQGGYTSAFTPLLTNGAYTHVQYTLDQAVQSGAFSNSANFNLLRIEGSGGTFGIDSGNVVRMDNFNLQVVPEPASASAAAAAAALGLSSLLGRARRRHRNR